MNKFSKGLLTAGTAFAIATTGVAAANATEAAPATTTTATTASTTATTALPTEGIKLPTEGVSLPTGQATDAQQAGDSSNDTLNKIEKFIKIGSTIIKVAKFLGGIFG